MDPEFRREWFRAELEASVPDLFRDLREIRGLTQADLAEKSEMKQSAISRFEASTEASWKLETLLRLADALDSRLSISLEPAESVIAKYAGEMRNAGGHGPKSAIEAASANSVPSQGPSRNIISDVWFERSQIQRHRTSQPNQMDNLVRGDRQWN